MKQETLTEQMNKRHSERMALMEGKGHDYATEDVLSNFKRVSRVCSIWRIIPGYSPADAALFLMVLKIDRWMNLRHKDEVKNESLEDTIKDLHNYIELAYACQLDSINEREALTRM